MLLHSTNVLPLVVICASLLPGRSGYSRNVAMSNAQNSPSQDQTTGQVVVTV